MDLQDTFVKLFTAAAKDDPNRRPSVQIVDGFWTLTIKGNRESWEEKVKVACVPSTAIQSINGDTLTVKWISIADEIFGPNGLFDRNLPGYEMRKPQLHMARLVQRSIEMGQPAIIEAGTGTGKSFAYAAVAMAMGKRCVISTSNKALQAQLYQKDIPFLCKLFPGKKVAMAQGKGNYLCRKKCQTTTPKAELTAIELSNAVGKLGKLWKEYNDTKDNDLLVEIKEIESIVTECRDAAYQAAAECETKIDNYTLAGWYKSTDTGNVEELDFHLSGVKAWTADDDCTGKRCAFHATCFYYNAKEKRKNADVVICNHALLILDRLYPDASILPGCDVVIVDEANKLADYARGALGQEFTIDGIKNTLSTAFDILREEHGSPTAIAEDYLKSFCYDVSALCGDSKDREIGVKHDYKLDAGIELATELGEIANLIWHPEDTPEDDDAFKLAKKADKVRLLAGKVFTFSSPTQPGNVRWIERETSKMVNVPFDVSTFIGEMAGFTTDAPATDDKTCCARCGRPLTSSVHVLEGRAYGPNCIRHVDLFGDAEIMPLSEWAQQAVEPETRHAPTAIIFTSATIAAPDLNHFMRTCGIKRGFQMIADSPFDYESNALLYVPNGDAPIPSAQNWQSYMIEELRKLVISSKGGAFCLFTSYSNMQYAVKSLRSSFQDAGLKVLVQNELPKGEITKQFKADGNAVLFATKSFWEGISIEGAALRLVVIDKLAFAAPSRLMKAREAAVSNPFIELHVPEMVIDLKQGTGRLIRRMDDWGVLALLDSRARLKPYGRSMVLPALPQARLTASTYEIDEFFQKRRAVVTKVVTDFPVTIDKKVMDELEELGF